MLLLPRHFFVVQSLGVLAQGLHLQAFGIGFAHRGLQSCLVRQRTLNIGLHPVVQSLQLGHELALVHVFLHAQLLGAVLQLVTVFVVQRQQAGTAGIERLEQLTRLRNRSLQFVDTALRLVFQRCPAGTGGLHGQPSISARKLWRVGCSSKPVCMSCCRNASICGRRAIAWSISAFEPLWYAPTWIRSTFCW